MVTFTLFLQLPASGSDVLIDRPILLDVTSLTLRQITIVGDGRLIFSDQVGDITITADGILVQVILKTLSHNMSKPFMISSYSGTCVNPLQTEKTLPYFILEESNCNFRYVCCVI